MHGYARHTSIRNSVALLLCLLFTKTVSASEVDLCEYHQGLKHGFDRSAYQRCELALKSCPKAALFHDKHCVSALLSKPFCRQLSSLADILHADVEMISVKVNDHYAIIAIHYPADGALQYYLLSPKGCLINTSVDPATIDEGFKRQYAKRDLYIEAKNAPSFVVLPDGRKQFSVNIEGRESCRACPVVVTATLGFTFNISDAWCKVGLIAYQ